MSHLLTQHSPHSPFMGYMCLTFTNWTLFSLSPSCLASCNGQPPMLPGDKPPYAIYRQPNLLFTIKNDPLVNIDIDVNLFNNIYPHINGSRVVNTTIA